MLPFLELTCNTEQAVDELIDVVGKGKTTRQTPQKVLAYDKTLLKKGAGTNVLFANAHVEFIKPDQLQNLGIVSAVQKAEKHLLE